MKAGDDPESSHEAAAKDDLAAHKGSAGVSNSTGRGSTVMSKEQKEGKDPIGRHIAEEQESHTDEGERVSGSIRVRYNNSGRTRMQIFPEHPNLLLTRKGSHFRTFLQLL